ncbi:unnamed protein product [Brachionus calyciflorus]|uniref:Pleckstrin homology domain-containing family A member 7 n=1 Tax=Brachionus calyciflorus TaxID=104777 RepID=A0A813Q2I3_9BILA|nr:unnamed protein product [Brachionus calyciflorus]
MATTTTPANPNVPNSIIQSIKSSASVMSSTNTTDNKNTHYPQGITGTVTNNEEYLNKKINFIQNHINNLLIEITNLPEPWTYAVTEDGRVFFINEDEQRTTWLHPKTGQPVSLMIIPPLEDLPNGWQKDYILGLPYLIDHNSKKNYPTSYLNNSASQEQNINTDSIEKKPVLIERSRMKNSPNKTTQPSEDYTQNIGECVNIETNINSALSSSSTSSSSSSNTSSSYQSNGNIIQANTVQINTAIDSALRKYGWLFKLSQNGLKLWRKRYFVLTDYILDYYSDSTMTKHCGTIFLNNTHSRPTIKKDGSSAYNKKNSFKVELVSTEDDGGDQGNDMFVYLAAESTSSMNEWINKFNFVSKLKNNSQNRNLYEKRTTSNRSCSNTSLRANNSNYFIVKHDNSSSKKSSKSNSAPSSPGATHRNIFPDNSNKKLRSSLSSNKIDDKNNPDRKVIKKKLAFSDDEILNDRPSKSKTTKNSKKKEVVYSDVDTDNEANNNERLNNSYNQKYLNESFENDSKSKHKRSSSLTKSAQKTSQNNLSSSKKNDKFGSTNHIYDYKSIYDAFEKPIVDMTRLTQSMINNNSSSNQDLNESTNRVENSKNYKVIQNLVNNSNKKNDQNDFYQYNKPGSQRSMDYIDRDKIAAAAEAAAAASAALEREKEKNLNSLKQTYSNNSSPKVVQSARPITNFYQITKPQLEVLQKNELEMIIRQLRRNFVLLNHSQQRFSMLQKLYEPYELMFQHRQNQLNSSKIEDGANINELTMSLHDSYQTIKDRIKKIENKMDSIENSLKLAQTIENNNSYQKVYEDPTNIDQINLNKFSNILRLYEYQIVEMQHENELLLEDKIIVEKLVDNQIGIFSKYQNLSCEKSLTQQFNALNQEMDLLKMQLSKVNQLLNDTITDKCKHELVYHQQIQNAQNKSQNETTSNLFRASLVNPSIDSKSNSSSIWKFSSPNILTKQNTSQSQNSQFSSTDNLLNQSSNKSYTTQCTKTTSYQAHHHQYYLNNKLNDNNIISKSIDSVYSPASSTGSSNKMNSSVNTNNYSAFNSINGKKLTIQSQQHNQDSSDEHNKSDSFQPVNFTNSRPRQLNITIQQPNHNAAFVPAKNQNFKRDIIAEKKRSSIGKFPQNYHAREYFQPIQNNNQTARERLFGNMSHQQSIGSIEVDQVNNRKIAMVKPELRGSCDNDLISRFTQQNQMEYFDADYSEEIIKNLDKPDVYSIPRGNIDIEPEIDLNDDERQLKEKRLVDIKKMIALQTFQQMNLDDVNQNSVQKHQNRSNMYLNSSNNLIENNRDYEIEVNYEKEKKAREHLLELRHELAEQIKEKTRQAALNSSTSKAINSLSNNSIDILDNNDVSKPVELLQTPNSKNYFNQENYYEYFEEDEKKTYEQKTYHSVESVYKNDLINSTPTLPSQFKNFFVSASILNAK